MLERLLSHQGWRHDEVTQSLAYFADKPDLEGRPAELDRIVSTIHRSMAWESPIDLAQLPKTRKLQEALKTQPHQNLLNPSELGELSQISPVVNAAMERTFRTMVEVINGFDPSDIAKLTVSPGRTVTELLIYGTGLAYDEINGQVADQEGTQPRILRPQISMAIREAIRVKAIAPTLRVDLQTRSRRAQPVA